MEITLVPQFFIEAPEGINPEAKQKMMAEITEAIDEAFHMRPDIQIWLREYPAENVAFDGRLDEGPMRPVCFLEAPELTNVDAKRIMAKKIDGAVAEAYRGIANTDEVLILTNQYPLEDAAWKGRLQADRPEVVEGIARLNA